MANQALSSLTAITTPASGDLLYIVDASDVSDSASGSSRKITYTNLVSNILSDAGVTSSVAELNILDGVTSTAAELNILDGVTSTAAELNILDGVTSTTAELNILDGVTSTATELNLLAGITTLSGSNTGDESAANTTTSGIVEIATIAETDTGTDAGRAVSPDGLQGSKRNIRYLQFRLIDSATSVATDTDVTGDFVCPFDGTILQDDTLHDQLFAWTDTAGETGTMVVDIHLNGTTIMTTNKLDIETTEQGTQTATTQPDLTTTDISAGDVLTFDIDAVHSGTAALGLVVGMAIRED